MPTVEISVVIPAYNMRPFIGRALASVQRQSVAPVEVIVVDDGSTDNTAQVAAGFDGVRVIRQANRERGAARNVGVNAARSRWIALLDADDEWLEHHLGRAWEKLQVEHADLTCGAYEVIDFFGQTLWTRIPWTERAFRDPFRVFERVKNGGLCASNVVARREVYEAFPFSEARAMSGAEDWHWFARLCGAVAIKPHHCCTVRYHHHGANSHFQAERWTSALRFALADLLTHPRFQSRGRRARRGVELSVAEALLADGQRRLAVSTLLALARRDPGAMLIPSWWTAGLRCTRDMAASQVVKKPGPPAPRA